jgi:hypothetical protein
MTDELLDITFIIKDGISGVSPETYELVEQKEKNHLIPLLYTVKHLFILNKIYEQFNEDLTVTFIYTIDFENDLFTLCDIKIYKTTFIDSDGE